MAFTSDLIALIFAFVAGINEVSGKEHSVTFNGSPIWTVGFGVSYVDMTINVGETLSFASYSDHDLVLVHKPTAGTPWDQCGQNGIAAGSFTNIASPSDFGSSIIKKHYTPPTCGDFFLACSVSAHCMFGQRVKVSVKNVDGSSCTSPCVDANCVTDSSKAAKTGVVVHDVTPVADSKYWGSGPFSGLEVQIGDTVAFRTGAGFHDVATVSSASAFDSCDMTNKVVVADWKYGTTVPSAVCNSSSVCCTGSSCGVSPATGAVTYTFEAKSQGDTYFVCSYGTHCQAGQKVHVKVKAMQNASTSGSTSTSGSSSLTSSKHLGVSVLVIAISVSFLLRE